MSALTDRLNHILHSVPEHPLGTPDSAAGCLDLAYERAYAEDHSGAIRAITAGLELPDADLITRLSLWGAMASIRHLSGDDDGARRAADARLSLLRSVGWDHQADMEADLGSLLFREATESEMPLLEAAVLTHGDAGAPDHVLADIKLALAVALHGAGNASALEALEWCADVYHAAGRPESEGGALLYLAHARATAGEADVAIAVADRLLELDLNRAMKAAVWMVKATANGDRGHHIEAEGCALEALDLYSGAGVRKGAVSAAAAVAQLAGQSADHDAAILAWKIAVEQAERGEFEETWAIRLALAHQLLDAEEFLLAEEVLRALVDRLGAFGRVTERARALVSLGHSLRHQERFDEALGMWREAVRTFEEAGLNGEAVRTLLALATLVAHEGAPAEARALYQRAVDLARDADSDPSALPTALHALGHSMCEGKDADGLNALDEAIRLADEHGADWHSADFRDTHARCAWMLGDGRRAVAEALDAADRFRSVSDPDAAGNAELFAAHVLTESQRLDEAAALYRLISSDHAESVAHVNAAQRGLADVLDAQGLTLQANEAREAAQKVVDDALDDAEATAYTVLAADEAAAAAGEDTPGDDEDEARGPHSAGEHPRDAEGPEEPREP
ncbi:tetratricopeptide repeat protein [Zhihengliuella halotolerans]|uniref:Tetratricopeptide repeat protein n=1 Tax=Zhihengliuella halotolerans TaxID=370736 RepID=A0A4Q8A9Z1_9MICC|nr:tetratricopeptide repeat protein [Zhihengliuella halotolerans]RZU60907.1 tetratricopeptide repeat protein [Zhihengliuella halotolerans]